MKYLSLKVKCLYLAIECPFQALALMVSIHRDFRINKEMEENMSNLIKIIGCFAVVVLICSIVLFTINREAPKRVVWLRALIMAALLFCAAFLRIHIEL